MLISSKAAAAGAALQAVALLQPQPLCSQCQCAGKAADLNIGNMKKEAYLLASACGWVGAGSQVESCPLHSTTMHSASPVQQSTASSAVALVACFRGSKCTFGDEARYRVFAGQRAGDMRCK